MANKLESWEVAERKPVERHPDVLRNRPLGVSDEEWKSQLAQVQQITAGVLRVLREYKPSIEEVNDLVIEAQIWLLEHPEEKHPYNAGRRMATDWRRRNFEREGRLQSFSDLSWYDGKCNTAVLEYNLESKKQIEKEKEATYSIDEVEPAAFLLIMQNWLPQELLEVKKAEPEAYAVVAAYLTRKEVPSNRFTRAESAAYERAVRRLRKVAR